MLDVFLTLILTEASENVGTDYLFFHYGTNTGKMEGNLF